MLLTQKVQLQWKKINRQNIKFILKSSSPFVLILVFMSTYNKLDGVMLGRLISDNNYSAGVYATAHRFYEAANMIGYLFAALLLPMFAAHSHQKTILQELSDIGLKYIVVSSTIIVLSCWFYGDIFLQLLISEYTPTFFVVLKLLIVGYMMVAIAYIFGTMLVACEKVKKLNMLFGLGLLLNFVLNCILIPKYLAIGAAICTLCTQIFVMCGQIYLVHKELDVRIRVVDISKLVMFFGISIVIFYSLKMSFAVHWSFILGFSILICLLLSFVLRIVDITDLLSLLKIRNKSEK